MQKFTSTIHDLAVDKTVYVILVTSSFIAALMRVINRTRQN